MARIYPFRALRYNPSLVRVADCVTQPYDKISPSLQQAYYARSPYNLVRIILGLPELFDEPGVNDVYTRAARDFRDWRAEGVLGQENELCLFAYAQRFTVPGTSRVAERQGIIALGELRPYEDGVVFRHEQTLAKPRQDRLQLLRATRAHFGQLLMLYSDPAMTVERMVFGELEGSAPEVPVIELTDDYDVLHRVWKISDPQTIQMVIGALEDKKLIIGDGHHRYETALKYRDERAPAAARAHAERAADALPQPLYPEAAVMMTLINMDGEGLTILPTHRLVHSLPAFERGAFLAAAQRFYEVRELPSPNDAEALTQALAQAGPRSFVAVTRGAAHLLMPKEGAVEAELAEVPERKRRLDVAQLHGLVLEQLLGLSPESIVEQRNVGYLREASEAIARVNEGDAQIAFLLLPVGLDQLREVTFAREVMPQKSTDFYPKLLSGLTVYALD